MSTDKILQRIQVQIDELTPLLELFVDDTIQPSVADCEQFQKTLSGLQENVAIFKYNKLNKEISPSFNIHAKLSAATVEKQEVPFPKKEIVEEIKETVKSEQEEKKDVEQNIPEVATTQEPKLEAKIDVTKEVPIAIGTKKPEPVQTSVPKMETAQTDSSPKPKAALTIGLNDKFRFMNELFGQNSPEYNIAIEQINAVINWAEAEIYLNSLKSVYEWDPKEEVVNYFYSVVKKRFE